MAGLNCCPALGDFVSNFDQFNLTFEADRSLMEMLCSQSSFLKTQGLVAIGYIVKKLIKFWDRTEMISVTPHLCFLFKLRAGTVDEDNVGFFEINRVDINSKYTNPHGYKWGPAPQDLEKCYLQWKGKKNW